MELTFRGSHEPIYWPVEQLTEHFGWCPGVEPDARGEWHYAPRWWLLCHMWIDESGAPAARRIVVVEQALPPSDLIDRPSLAVDPERVRTFAAWLEQQRDWSSRTASSDFRNYRLRSEMRSTGSTPLQTSGRSLREVLLIRHDRSLTPLRIRDLAREPRRVGKPLGGDIAGQHSARRGPYRILYRVDDGAETIWVHRVDLRANVYRSP